MPTFSALALLLPLVLRCATAQVAVGRPSAPSPLPQPAVMAQPPALASQPAAEAQVIWADQTYFPAKGVLVAPNTAVMGPQLNASAPAGSIEACSDFCRATPGCSWFVYCSDAGGCMDGSGGELPYQECELLGETCTLPALAHTTSTQVQVASGFPTASVFGDQVLKFTELQGQGIEGADFHCASSLVPGTCTLTNLDEAILVCHALGTQCPAITVYFKGLDGCSEGPVAVLKKEAPYPDNTWVSPHTSTLINFEAPASYPFFLYEDEATVQVPTDAELEANTASLAQNGTAWWGCTRAQCVASGTDVAVLDDIDSAEACCHACADRFDGTPRAAETGKSCNVWNYCSQPGGCSFAGASFSPNPLSLGYRQCQLRYSSLSNVTYGGPLIVAAKGNASQFECGAPLSFFATELPGYTKMPGLGLFLSGIYNCSDSARPMWDCMPLTTNLTELGLGCLDDPQCVSMPVKQALPPEYGFYNMSSRYRGYRKATASGLVIVPTTNLYVVQSRTNASGVAADSGSDSSGSGSSSGLSTGAIAGIAVGACAGAVLIAGVAWAAIRRRRQRSAAAPTLDTSLESGKGGSSGSSQMDDKAGSADSSLPLPSPERSEALLAGQTGSTGSLQHGEGSLLPELLERVASMEAAAASNQGGSPTPSEHMLLSVHSLPPRLRECLVPPSAVSYCRWPNGQPLEIGAGATSRVYKAVLNGEIVAAKEIDLVSSQLKQEAFITEALRLQQLRHPNVVALMGIALTPRSGVLLLEYCDGRDLHAAMDVLARGTQERLFGWYRRGRHIALEVAKALNFLHSKGIVHLDVKSPNVLLTGNGTAKLADVGFSREKLHTFLSDLNNVGTFAWAAPEILLARQCTNKVDIYSFGVLCWEIVTGQRPRRGQLRLPRVPQECPQAVSDLILECLHQDPAKRPTALELLQRLSRLAGPPSFGAQPAADGGSDGVQAQARAACEEMGESAPPAGRTPSPGASEESISPASQQQWKLLSPFLAQAGIVPAGQQQRREQSE